METKLKCWLKGVPADGRLVAKATFSQIQSLYGGYPRMEFEKGTSVVIISASVDNSYLLFGYKETPQTLNKTVDKVNVYAIESTTVKP